MVRIFGAVLLGTVIGLTSGCTLDSFTVTARSNIPEQSLSGSVDMVSISVETVMRNTGLFVERKAQGDTIRISSKVPDTGDKFTVVLREQKGEPVARTFIRVEWDRAPNEKFWLTLFQMILAAQQQPPQMGMAAMNGQQGMTPMAGGQAWAGNPYPQTGNNPMMMQSGYPPQQQNQYYPGAMGQPTYPGVRPGMGQ